MQAGVPRISLKGVYQGRRSIFGWGGGDKTTKRKGVLGEGAKRPSWEGFFSSSEIRLSKSHFRAFEEKQRFSIKKK